MIAGELYCPRCASPMQRVGPELTCVPGDMGLSRNMERALLARFGARVRIDAPAPASTAPWYCPACRLPLAADMTCTECGGTIRDLESQLVELHPHRKPA